MSHENSSDRVTQIGLNTQVLPWWRSSTGVVLITVMLHFLVTAMVMIPRLPTTRPLVVNGLEVLRDIEPTRIPVGIDDVKQKTRMYLEGLLKKPLGDEYRIYARPWSSDATSRYFALIDNSIDAFNSLKDTFIIREGWRLDVRDKRSGLFPWSVYLDSMGRLLFCQQNLEPGANIKAISLDRARALAHRSLARTVYTEIPSFHQCSVTQLNDGRGWLFSFSDSLEHELVKGRPVLNLTVEGGAVTSFWPGLSMPDEDADRIGRAEKITKALKLGAMLFILAFMLRLFVYGIIKMIQGKADMKIFWKLLTALSLMILYNVHDRFHQLRLWIAKPELPQFNGWFLYLAGFGLALFLATHLAWCLKWMKERKIEPNYMPLLAGKLPLINLCSVTSVLGVILLIANMGLANMFAGPAETLPIYSNRVSLSFIMFAMYLLALGYMMASLHRWETVRHSLPMKILAGLVGFLAVCSVTVLGYLPLYIGPFRIRALIMIFCLIPSVMLTALLILYQMRIKSWYLLSIVWLSSQLFSEFVAPTHHHGGLNFLILIGLIALYGWLLLVWGQKEPKPGLSQDISAPRPG